ncbi:hypothetical protein [Nocardia sp. NPDC052566]|uniref:hypothetical protein n=1 Tax=Nocardia sp. NPDC052566 TaxID=3364330 RepID=UPI0037CA3FF9
MADSTRMDVRGSVPGVARIGNAIMRSRSFAAAVAGFVTAVLSSVVAQAQPQVDGFDVVHTDLRASIASTSPEVLGVVDQLLAVVNGDVRTPVHTFHGEGPLAEMPPSYAPSCIVPAGVVGPPSLDSVVVPTVRFSGHTTPFTGNHSAWFSFVADGAEQVLEPDDPYPLTRPLQLLWLNTGDGSWGRNNFYPQGDPSNLLTTVAGSLFAGQVHGTLWAVVWGQVRHRYDRIPGITYVCDYSPSFARFDDLSEEPGLFPLN